MQIIAPGAYPDNLASIKHFNSFWLISYMQKSLISDLQQIQKMGLDSGVDVGAN